MKNALLKLAIIGAFSASGYAQAAWESMPAAGFASSAYTSCFNTGRDETPGPAGDGVGGAANDRRGNFGSYPIASANYPASGTNDTCWVAFSGSEATLPAGKTGFTATASVTRSIPNPTGGASIGEVYDRYWRNPTTNTCIIGTRVRMYNVDSDAATGTQYFEVNDVVRGGFSGLGAVSVAYTISITPVTVVSPVFRAGRTFTSVQHRAYKYDTLVNKSLNGTNYLDLPTKNSVTAATTGEATGINSTTAASTTLATQDAVVNDNYVDFTADAVYADDDGSTNAYSAFTYVEASCSANPTTQTGGIRLRQTGQENAVQKVIDMDGYAIGTP
ncbi:MULTISPECIES: hypothetical protein [unclassified Methylophilus]|uniref:hypothetical protein n=1 Tax=unclassified Methylophilus TaxID=2630143 RepID=UPI00039D3A76|nr:MULTISPECIES: hypothetical protein [unclassified Methylophilus]